MMDPLEKRWAALTPEQRRLLEVRMKQQGVQMPVAERPKLHKVPRGKPLPLSFAQERLWFLQALDKDGEFNITLAVRLDGPLDVPVLERCFSELVRRHESLRTVFTVEAGQPSQLPMEGMKVPWRVVDVSTRDDASVEAQRIAARESVQRFDLERGPLWQATLVRLGERQHLLVLVVHHIISDGWSMGVLNQELAGLYQAFLAGRPSPLPEPLFQYADHAACQREAMQGIERERQLSYWKEVFARGVPALELAPDRPRTASLTMRGASEPVSIAANITLALKNLGRAENASLFMVVLAALEVLLYRQTGQESFAIGCPIAGRTSAEVEGMVGLFLNTVPMRADLSESPTFRQLLRRVRETALGGFAHQDLPLEHVLQSLALDRQSGRASLFQAMLLVQNQPAARVQLNELTLTPVKVEGGEDDTQRAPTADFVLELFEEEGRLKGEFVYNANLFEAATMRGMMAGFLTLLEGIVTDADQPIPRLPIINPASTGAILNWSRGPAQPEPLASALARIEAQVQRSPESIAVLEGDRQLTYRELDVRANQLAHHLVHIGVEPKTVVGLCLPRSLEAIVGLLGILKAGAAYAPFDPRYPPERLRVLLEDLQCAALVTSSSHLPDLRGLPTRPVQVDADQQTLASYSQEKAPWVPSPNSLAYVIYTSGSTGKPKGVLLEHRSLDSFVNSSISEYALGPTDRVLQFASLSFDASIEEIFPALAGGATLVLRDDEMLRSAEAFFAACVQGGITVLDLPTAFWHELVLSMEQRNLKLPAALRLIILGGERALPERVRTWHRLVSPAVRLVNTYGPTEATVVTTLANLTPDVAQGPQHEMPMGRPLPGVETYVMENGQLAPIGVPGELHIGGVGLARGYWNRPALDQEVFIPNPFGSPGSRVYRTGDRVRWRPDGMLEFLGRTDHQVKIRGFRIELGEIEAALSAVGARQSAVLLREDVPGEQKLVAYVALDPGSNLSAAELRKRLAERLPEYMVPSAWVVLPDLPMTTGGKVNRTALRAPEQDRAAAAPEHVEPSGDAERVLADIWREVLGLDKVGAHDNFFELGGHSLLLPRVLHRVREQFQVDLPLRALLNEPTLAGLALAVEEAVLDQIELGAPETGAP